jgi:hypothetical protein
MRVEGEGRVDAALERIVDDEIESGEVGQDVANDAACSPIREQRADPRLRDLVKKHRPGLGMVGDDADVEPVAFVAGPPVRDPVQGQPRHSVRRHDLASWKRKQEGARSRGIR